jgi:probable HAF family extracellular repeat protein
MKSRKLMFISAMTLFTLLAIPARLAAQDNQDHNHKHARYRLVDLGTFGGPNSEIVYAPFFGSPKQINSRGTTVGGATTSTPTTTNSNPLACGVFVPILEFVNHALAWQKGVVTDLGSLAGEDHCSDATSINARGEIAGVSENAVIDPLLGVNELRAVVWKNGGIKDLGTLGGSHSMGAGINSHGQVVGLALNGIADPFSIFDLQIFGSSNGTQTRAFVWDKHNGMQDLGTLGTGNDAWGNFENERGQVFGSSYTNTTPNPVTGLPTTHPFLWERGQGMTDLGSLGGTVAGSEVADFAGGINNLGQVAGGSTLAGDMIFHPFLWTKPGPMQDLGTLGGDNATAYALSDAGEVVGYSELPGNQVFDAFLWKNGVLTDLGTVGGDACSCANAINSSGQIVGCDLSTVADPFHPGCDTSQHATLWENGQKFDLNTLIPPHSALSLTRAYAINDHGVIAGIGNPAGCPFDNICGHAFVLIPCDDGRSHAEDCEGDAERTAAIPQTSPVLVMQNPTMNGPSPNERMSAIRARLAHRYPYRGFATYQPK